jgi:hypothetical protein
LQTFEEDWSPWTLEETGQGQGVGMGVGMGMGQGVGVGMGQTQGVEQGTPGMGIGGIGGMGQGQMGQGQGQEQGQGMQVMGQETRTQTQTQTQTPMQPMHVQDEGRAHFELSKHRDVYLRRMTMTRLVQPIDHNNAAYLEGKMKDQSRYEQGVGYDLHESNTPAGRALLLYTIYYTTHLYILYLIPNTLYLIPYTVHLYTHTGRALLPFKRGVSATTDKTAFGEQVLYCYIYVYICLYIPIYPYLSP